jgi:poly[(R)-3-hydroxyalkanoate] polymerase subunit PhaE
MVSEQTNNNNNDNKKEAPTGNTIDPVQFGEEINKMLGIWSELSKLPTVGPNHAYSEEFRSDVQDFVNLGRVLFQLQINLNDYWLMISRASLRAQMTISNKSSEKYNSNDGSARSFEIYRKIMIDALEESFTGLFNSSEFAIVYGKLLNNQMDALKLVQTLAEKNLKVLNLPTRSEMDMLSRDVHDLKKNVHDLRNKLELSTKNDTRNIIA